MDAVVADARPDSSGNMEVPVIRVLPSRVVCRIAAGEVIHHTSSALKEILENSLDAGAKQIDVVFFDGGCSFQLRDDGSGIRSDDLPILCQSHTTSKLKDVEDLKTLRTLGFRGEALCSVSFVARLTVTTRPKTSPYGMRVTYTNGEIQRGPTACPGLQGTTVRVEDVFLDHPVRRQPQRSADDYSRGREIVQSYALHCTEVGFTVRREEGRKAELFVKQNETPLVRMAMLFGCDLVQNITQVNKEMHQPEGACFALSGWISTANYTGRRWTFVLFVNDRWVQSSPLKRAVHGVYASLLPKRMPFAYLSLQLPTSHVDVNVHPTKREIDLLFREEIIQSVTEAIEEQLRSSMESQSFKPAGKVQILAEDMAHTASPMDLLLSERETKVAQTHHRARKIIEGHRYIGMADGRFVFVEFQKELYLFDIKSLSQEFFCQLIWKGIGKLECTKLRSSIRIANRLVKALDVGCAVQGSVPGGNVEGLSSFQHTPCNRSFLRDTFSMEITSDGHLSSLPQLLRSYPLNLSAVPVFLEALTLQVEGWNKGQATMQELVEVFAGMFCMTMEASDQDDSHMKCVVEHILLPVMREEYHPSTERVLDNNIVQLASIKQLCLRCGR